MAAEITDKQYNALVAELKKNPGNSERHYAEKTGIPLGQIGSVLYKAELEADPSLKIAGTGKAVTAGRSKGLRWPRLAAYTGLPVSKVKELYEEVNGKGSASESWTGRGRKVGGGSAPAATTTGRRGAAAATPRGTSGRRAQATAAPAGTSGRRGKRGAASPS